MLESPPTIQYFTLDYPIGIIVGYPIRLHQLREVRAYPLSTLTLDLFCFEKTRREDYSIECKAFMLYNAPSLYRVLAFVLGIFLESGLI